MVMQKTSRDTCKMRLAARIEHLERLIQFVSDFLLDQGLTEKKTVKAELATEQALVNIFEHAYTEDTGDVEVRCRKHDNGVLTVEILDEGIPFDVRAFPDPELTPDISSRKIGGLGIFLMHKMVDNVHYSREGDHNILTLSIHTGE